MHVLLASLTAKGHKVTQSWTTKYKQKLFLVKGMEVLAVSLCPSCSSEPWAGLSIQYLSLLPYSSYTAAPGGLGSTSLRILAIRVAVWSQYSRETWKTQEVQKPFYWSFDSNKQIHGLRQNTDLWLFLFESPASMPSTAIMISYSLGSYSFQTPQLAADSEPAVNYADLHASRPSSRQPRKRSIPFTETPSQLKTSIFCFPEQP